jgi:acyl-lipid omega-3 desaturase
MFHNHEEKDYSYNWYTEERLSQSLEAGGRKFHDGTLPSRALRFVYPFIAWPLYLFGIDDGSHLLPIATQRLWKEGTPKVERKKCLISSAVVVGFLGAIAALSGFDLGKMMFFYGVPYVVFSWWLFTVTYLQHHAKDTVVYQEKDWDFVTGGFETVDRSYGLGIDHLGHHITDGHVAHHLFFTQIPHYHLPIATQAIKKYFHENGLMKYYRHENTKDFIVRVHRYMLDFGFKVKRAEQKPYPLDTTVITMIEEKNTTGDK